ncbi:MAG: VTT domain-containing protein [Candidatus Micrarchaeota archaeon]|nr:VTT domain-containing protein [Candidatus Micrarchaeota archaeon]
MLVRFGKSEIVAFLAAVVIAVSAMLAFRHISFLRQLGYLEILAVSFVSSATVLLPLPGFAVVFAAAQYLNPFLLGLSAGIGSGLGEISGYLAGTVGHRTLTTTTFFEKHKLQLQKYGWPVVFLLAVIPNPAFDVVGLAAGAIKMEWWKFLSAAILGKSTRYIALALLGEFSAGWI